VPATLDFNQGDALKLLEADIEGMSSEDVVDAFQRFWTTFPGQVGGSMFDRAVW
jgi:hypothetical protein